MSGEMEPQALAEASAARMWEGDAATRALGARLERIAPGEAVMVMTARADQANGFGMVHGGVIFTLADTAFAYACNSHGMMTVAQHCSITFLRPGAVESELRAEAREVSRAGRSGLYDIRVTDGAGAVVAEFRGHSRGLGKPILEETE